VEPVIQGKIQLLAKNSAWYTNNTLSYKAVNYVPTKVYAQRFPLLDGGINFGYSFANRCYLSFGIFTETPQIGYTIMYLEYDSVRKVKYTNDISSIGRVFLTKFPITAGIYLGSVNSRSTE